MALSIGVQKGSKILVGGTPVNVTDIAYGHSVRLQVDDDEFLITEQERTEILPEVFVSYGKNPEKMNQPSARLAFEAPRSIRILRA